MKNKKKFRVTYWVGGFIAHADYETMQEAEEAIEKLRDEEDILVNEEIEENIWE